jgi:hypothetical protein
MKLMFHVSHRSVLDLVWVWHLQHVDTSAVRFLPHRRLLATLEWSLYCIIRISKEGYFEDVAINFSPSTVSAKLINNGLSTKAYMIMLSKHLYRTEHSIGQCFERNPFMSHLEVVFWNKACRISTKVSPKLCSLRMWYKWSCETLSKAG